MTDPSHSIRSALFVALLVTALGCADQIPPPQISPSDSGGKTTQTGRSESGSGGQSSASSSDRGETATGGQRAVSSGGTGGVVQADAGNRDAYVGAAGGTGVPGAAGNTAVSPRGGVAGNTAPVPAQGGGGVATTSSGGTVATTTARPNGGAAGTRTTKHTGGAAGGTSVTSEGGAAGTTPVLSSGGAGGATTAVSAGGFNGSTGGTSASGGSSGTQAGNSPRESCAAEPLRATGQIHYVCDCQAGAAASCVAGNDNNSGTSPSSPLQTLSKAASIFSSMSAGDTVALCRGGRWNVTQGVGFSNAKCSKTNTCDLRDYPSPSGNSSDGLPSIWINGGSNGATTFSFSHQPAHQEGFRVINLDLHGTNTDTAFFFWNETTDVDLCDLSMDGFNISVNMSGGDQPTYGTPANITLRGSRITNNSNIGYIAVCDNCSVEDNFFDNNGVATATTHSVYFASQVWTVNGQTVVHTTTGMRLSRNEIHHSAIQCNGSPVVVHGRQQDVVIEDNIIDAVNAADGCWGPGVGCGGYPYGCWFRNTIIRRNTIKGLGNAGSENDNCLDCLIENNLIIMTRSGNAINLGGKPPRVAGDSSYTRWDGQPDDPTNNAVVRNNTIYFTNAAASGQGIAVSSGTGHKVQNNAIYFAATTPGPSDNLCYRVSGSATSAIAAADYNVCLIPSGAHWSGSSGLSDWQTATGFDTHSKMTDPMFTNPTTDFTPAAGSPLVNAGDATCSASGDLRGTQRDAQPDIGAFER